MIFQVNGEKMDYSTNGSGTIEGASGKKFEKFACYTKIYFQMTKGLSIKYKTKKVL